MKREYETKMRTDKSTIGIALFLGISLIILFIWEVSFSFRDRDPLFYLVDIFLIFVLIACYLIFWDLIQWRLEVTTEKIVIRKPKLFAPWSFKAETIMLSEIKKYQRSESLLNFIKKDGNFNFFDVKNPNEEKIKEIDVIDEILLKSKVKREAV